MPGDPSNDPILSATPAFGGIDVTWNYPTTNPQAVAYTKVYRALVDDFNAAILIVEVAGSFFYDRLETATRYYYWIKMVSVNGTIGELIGPASAIAKPTIEATIELLTGQIDSGLLATSLRNEIARIQTLDLALAGEVVSRENGETTLAEAVADAQAGVAQTLTFLANEQTSRVIGDSALATSLELVAVTAADNLAAVTTVLRAEIDAVTGEVTSEMLNTVVAQTADNLAAVQDVLHAEVVTVGDDVALLASRVDTVQAGDNMFDAFQTWDFNGTVDGWVVANNLTLTTNPNSLTMASTGTDPEIRSPGISIDGALYDKIRMRVKRLSGSDWEGSVFFANAGHGDSESFKNVIPDITTIGKWVVLEWDMAALTNGGTDWSTHTNTNLRIDLAAISGSFEIDWISIGRRGAGASAAAQTTLTATVATTNGVVSLIGARWTAQVNVNGLVGGFGVYNDSAEVQAGFDVDTFWIGRTSGDKRKPFIISGGIVYIDQAAIPVLSAGHIGANTITTNKIQVGAVTSAAEVLHNTSYLPITVGSTSFDTGYLNALTITSTGAYVTLSGYATIDFTLFSALTNTRVNTTTSYRADGGSSITSTREHCMLATEPSGAQTGTVTVPISARVLLSAGSHTFSFRTTFIWVSASTAGTEAQITYYVIAQENKV